MSGLSNIDPNLTTFEPYASQFNGTHVECIGRTASVGAENYSVIDGWGLHFAGLDLIRNTFLEINVCTPRFIIIANRLSRPTLTIKISIMSNF
jgi:hypothetical protein